MSELIAKMGRLEEWERLYGKPPSSFMVNVMTLPFIIKVRYLSAFFSCSPASWSSSSTAFSKTFSRAPPSHL